MQFFLIKKQTLSGLNEIVVWFKKEKKCTRKAGNLTMVYQNYLQN